MFGNTLGKLVATIPTGNSLAVDERAVSATLSYALTLAITTLLVTGLVFAVGTEVENRRDSAVRTEMDVIGNQLAATLGSADRLADASGTNGVVVLHRALPDTVAGTDYRIRVVEQAPGDYDLRLTSTNPEQTVVVTARLNNSIEPTTVSSGPVTVAYDTVTDTITVESSGDRAFDERGGVVSMEAEHLTGIRSGRDAESDHRWYAYDDTAASGDVAVTTAPNVSSGVGTAGHTGDSTTGTRLDYDVDFESAGTYYVFVRMKAPGTNSGESDSVHVGINGTEPASYGGQGLGEGVGSGGWTWAHGVSSDGTGGDYVSLEVDSPGRHTINLYMREDGTQVDKIVLKQTQSAPSDEGPEETT